jgi:hypothetical protein
MKTYTQQEITKQENILDAVFCNMCGKVLYPNQEEYQDFYISWGYLSHHDRENWYFELCENCLEKIVLKFIIPMDVEYYI